MEVSIQYLTQSGEILIHGGSDDVIYMCPGHI